MDKEKIRLHLGVVRMYTPQIHPISGYLSVPRRSIAIAELVVVVQNVDLVKSWLLEDQMGQRWVVLDMPRTRASSFQMRHDGSSPE